MSRAAALIQVRDMATWGAAENSRCVAPLLHATGYEFSVAFLLCCVVCTQRRHCRMIQDCSSIRLIQLYTLSEVLPASTQERSRENSKRSSEVLPEWLPAAGAPSEKQANEPRDNISTRVHHHSTQQSGK